MEESMNRVDDLSPTSPTLSESTKYYLKVVPSAFLGTLLLAWLASTSADIVGIFFALVCGGLSITVAIFGIVLVSFRMIRDEDNRDRY